ncbi:unnamed protein product [Heterobilharzia americana]|nr:unnamed protein product [Heterobilharzia americana]
MPSNQTIEMLRPLMKDFESIVLPYWYKFQQPHPYYQYAVGLFIAFFGITGVCLNLLVIIFFTTVKALRTPSNMLVVNLAVSDFGFSAVNGFPLKTMSAFNNFWPWGKTACDLYGLAGGLFGFVSLSTIAAVAVDRYMVIATPFESVFQTTNRRTIMLMLFLWVWSLIWTIPPLFGFGRYVLEGYQTSCTFDYISTDFSNRLFNIGLFGFGFLCPLFLSIFCYARIVLIVKRRGKDFMEMAARTSTKSDNQKAKSATVASTKSDNFVLKSAGILLGVYSLCWTPYAAPYGTHASTLSDTLDFVHFFSVGLDQGSLEGIKAKPELRPREKRRLSVMLKNRCLFMVAVKIEEYYSSSYVPQNVFLVLK